MDTIAEMLTRIRNAQAVQKETADVPFSGINLKIAQILLGKNFIKEIKKIRKKESRFLRIFLKYKLDKTPAISGIKMISKPGKRIYKGFKQIKSVKRGYGLSIVSTSKGVLSGEEAKRNKVGGEIITEIW